MLKDRQEKGLALENLLGFQTSSGKMITAVFYAAIAACVIYLPFHVLNNAVGDEPFYISSAQAIAKNGLYAEMAKGNPVGYTYLLLMVSRLGFSMLVAGYVITGVFTIVLFIGFRILARRFFGLQGAWLEMGYISALFGLLSGNYLCVTGDDVYYSAIFIWVMVLMFDTVQKRRSWRWFALSGALVSATLIIRPLSLIFFAAALPAFTLVFFGEKIPAGRKTASLFAFAGSFVILFLLQQYPALHEKGTVVFETKIPDSAHTQANWEQKNTLTNILIEQGIKPEEDGPRASWQQCNDYLEKHGPASLPTNPVARIFWNPVSAFKYALIGVAKMVFSFFYHTGIIFLLPVYFLFKKPRDENRGFLFLTWLILFYLALYIFNGLNVFENRHVLIPYIFLSLLGARVLQITKKEGNIIVGRLALLQFAAMCVILLLTLKYFFIHAPGVVFYY